MKKYKYVMLLLLIISMINLNGCSNQNVPSEDNTIPESTTVARTTEAESTSASETTKSKEAETNTESTVKKESSMMEESTSAEEKTSETSAGNRETTETVTEKETTLPAETTTAAPVILQGFLFAANGIQIGMHEDAEGVLAALGTADAYFETPSCAFLGMDKQYTYGSYMLTTYEENGREYVYDVYFLDEGVSTPEGIRIGSGMDEMVAAYGDGYTEDFGMYTYVKERSKLQFLIEDGVVISVDYTALTD